MLTGQHIYTYTYDETESEICKLETKYIFGKEEKNKILFADKTIDPSCSPFLKRRIDISSYSSNYNTFIQSIKDEKLSAEGFKIEYLVVDGDTTEYDVRLNQMRDIGFSIDGEPDYYNPTKTYGMCYYAGIWYFGELTKNDFAWHAHKKKPKSYSISININIGKALVNIACKANKNSAIIDACCGVGTVLLEACIAGYNIEGCDINWKIYNDAKENMAFFDYSAPIFRADIAELEKQYDTAIVDLPYNLYSNASENDILHILESAAKISKRLVIVSTADISEQIVHIGHQITDHCTVSKSGKRVFTRQIWVCEKMT